MSPRTLLVALLVSVLVFPPSIFADAINWTNANGNSSYGDAGNWDLGVVPSNGGGLTFDVTIDHNGPDDVIFDIGNTTINSLALSGTGFSALELNNPNNDGSTLTLGTPTVLTGNVLAVNNGGILNINSGSSAILELSGGASAAVADGGEISLADAGTLVLQNTSGAASTIQNDGIISLTGFFTPATLQLNDGGSGSTFTLAGSGTLILDGFGQIATQQSGLINDVGHTISGNGSITVGESFQGVGGHSSELLPGNFTNNGILRASADLPLGSALSVNTNLTNWNGSDLQGGTYIVDDGATLTLTSIGSASIQGLTGNAALTISGSGQLSGGPGSGTSQTLGGLTNITDSSLTLNGVTALEITPTGGTLTLAATPTGIPASLTLDSFNGTGSSVVVHGAFTNSVDTTTSGLTNSSTLTVQNGSTLTTGDFLNQSRVGIFLNGSNVTNDADANVNVLGGSTLTVDSLTTSTNNGFSNSNINVTDSFLNVGAGGVHQGFSDGGPGYSTGSDTMTFTNSTVGVSGSFSNNNSLNYSTVNVIGSSLAVDGAFTQDQANGAFGGSSLNLSALDLGGGDGLVASTATVGGLTNSSFVFNSGLVTETPKSQVSITGGSSLTVLGTNTFTNVSAGGVLSGGGYTVGTNSTLNYAGADINTIDTHTFLTLDNSGEEVTGAFLNNGHDAISDSLTNIDGHLALQNHASLTLTPASLTVGSSVFNSGESNENPASQISITGASNLVVQGNFTNVSAGGVLSGGGYTVGTDSTLNYVGADINTIDTHTFLTLDNAWQGATGAFLNNGHDAISDSLTNIDGHLALQNNASLTLTPASLTVGSSVFNSGASDENPASQISITGASNLVVQGNFANVSAGGVLSGGGYVLGTDSFLDYSGADINTLDQHTFVTLGNNDNGGTGGFRNSGHDALSNSLSAINGVLTLQNNATLELTQQNLSVGSIGQINVGDKSTLQLQNTDQNGLTALDNEGVISVASQATLALNDNGNASVFQLTGQGTLNLSGQGRILGVSGDESLVNGEGHTISGNGVITNLFLQNLGAIDAVGGDLTIDLSAANETDNFGNINVAEGSSLTIRDTSGAGSSTIYNAGAINLNGVATDPALIFDSGGLDNTFTLSGRGSVNMSSSGTNAIYGASGHESLINDFDHSINGGGTIHDFVAFTNNGTLESNAGSPLIVAQSANLTNWNGGNNHLYGGNYVVDAGSTMQLEAIGAGQQIQTLNGASVALFGTGGAGPDGFLTGFDGVTNAAAGISKIYSGGTGEASLSLNSLSGTTQLATDSNGRFTVASNDNNEFNDGSASLNLSGTSAAVAGDFVNRAKTYTDEGYANSQLNLDSGSSLTIGSQDAPHDLTNQATTNGDFSRAFALVNVTNGSTLTVNGNVSNTSVDNSTFGQSLAAAGISVDGSQLFVSGTFTNTGSLIFGDTSDGFGQIPGAILSLTGLSTATVGGLFTNDQNSGVFLDNQGFSGGGQRPAGANAPLLTSLTTSNGFSNAGLVTLNNGSLLDNTGLFQNTGATAEIDISSGSSLVNHGAFANSDGAVYVDGLGTTLQVHGTFDNTALTSLGAELSLTGGSQATVDGQFTNSTGSFVDLDLSCGCPSGPALAAPAGGSTVTTLEGFSNAGTVTLNLNSTINNTGTFVNTGLITLDNASTLTSAAAPPLPAGGVPIVADFQNSGTITTGSIGEGGNKINVTGTIFNTSPGVVNLEGFGDKITATGQFTNIGAVNLDGGSTKVWSATGIDNQAGGQISLNSKGNKVASAGAVTNEGTISFTGGGGKVWSGTSIDNSGLISMTGNGDVVSSEGDITNEGTFNIGNGEAVRADGNYIQTAGQTTLDAGGTLTATQVELSGGVLSGFGTITGNLLIDGGTLAPGDPQAIDIIGDYTQTSGLLDLDFLDLLHFDQVDITGNANLGGTLEVDLDPNFDPTGITLNSLFEIMSWTGSRTGGFASFVSPTFNGLTFLQSFNANGTELDLRVVSADTSATPEPSTFAMLFGAMMLGGAITWGRNRRRAGRAS